MASKLISVNVVLGPEAARSHEATLAKLREAGLREANVMEAIGIVSGRVAPEHLAELKKVRGVTVEADETIRIPPPDSPVQ